MSTFFYVSLAGVGKEGSENTYFDYIKDEEGNL